MGDGHETVDRERGPCFGNDVCRCIGGFRTGRWRCQSQLGYRHRQAATAASASSTPTNGYVRKRNRQASSGAGRRAWLSARHGRLGRPCEPPVWLASPRRPQRVSRLAGDRVSSGPSPGFVQRSPPWAAGPSDVPLAASPPRCRPGDDQPAVMIFAARHSLMRQAFLAHGQRRYA